MTKKHKCPRCKTGVLAKNGHDARGRQLWIHRTSEGVCYKTLHPTKPERRQNGSVVKRVPIPKQELRGERFVVTWAQNATPVHAEFLACLKTFCKAENAQLLVIPGRYKNPTSQWTQSQQNEEQWAPEVTPYLMADRRRLNDNLIVLGDYKVQPTRVRPLTGIEGVTGPQSTLLGHPKLQFKTVATPSHKMAKIMSTTGSVTVRNYTDSSAGKGGEFHHIFGAALVEVVSSKLFHLHQLNYSVKDHGFIHLDKAYYADRVEAAPQTKALIFGDAHARFADPAVVQATFGPRGLVEKLNPKELGFHDLLDAYAVNPHHFGNPFIAVAKQRSGFDNIAEEVRYTIKWLKEVSGGRKSFIVRSNHDDMLKRWVIREDWKRDPVNAEFYLETALHMVRSVEMTEHGTDVLDPFQYWVQRAKLPNVTCLAGSYSIADIELSLHGDAGPDGARGSVMNLSRIGMRVMSGHGHSPAIEEGHYRLGTMTHLKLEYTGPVGSWLNTHGSIDGFGKRHLHTCINGSFWL